MKVKISWLFPLTFLLMAGLISCQSHKHEELELALAKANANLAATQAALEQAQHTMHSPLTHMVLFTLKEGISDAETTAFTDSLAKLGTIPLVKRFSLGKPAATGDPRLVTNYDLVMTMGFASQADLAAYQQDATHLAIRAATKSLLGGPPMVYDFE